MKTLVLTTADLLTGEGYGAAVARWYASMGGPRRDAGRPGAAPEPQLYDMIAEGFLFHRGSTDPVLLIGGARWEAAMHALLQMIRGLPTSLAALSSILAFPYFLPSSRAEIKEFQTKVPLAILLMRVPPSESEGDRHDKRVQGWEATATTVRDIAATTLPPESAKAAASVPHVVRYIRDREEDRLAALRSRVDFVELPGLRTRLADPEFQDGRKRRKEAWRIGTAMENAAILLEKPRGRQLSMSSETAKRAREYLDAAPRRPAAGAGRTKDRPETASRPPSELAEEEVPVPIRIDPMRPGPGPRFAPLGGPASTELSVLDERAIRKIVDQELDRRGAAGGTPRQLLAEEIARSISLGVASAREQLEHQLGSRLQRVEDRLQRMSGVAPAAGGAEPPTLERAVAELEERFRRVSEETRVTLRTEIDRQLQALAQREKEARGSLETRVAAASDARTREVRELLQRAQDDAQGKLGSLIVAELDRRAAAAPPEDPAAAEAAAALEARLQERVDQKVAEALASQQEKLAALLGSVRRSLERPGWAGLDTEEADRVLSEHAQAAIDANVAPMLERATGEVRTALETVRTEQAEMLERVDALDRRTQVLVDRLVPVVRKAWVKISEMQRSPGEGAAPDVGLVDLRREFQAEAHRIEGETQRRIHDLRQQMETALGHQSRVWLTLIQQLSQLTSERLESAENAPNPPTEDVWEEPPAPEGDGADLPGSRETREPRAPAARASDRDRSRPADPP